MRTDGYLQLVERTTEVCPGAGEAPQSVAGDREGHAGRDGFAQQLLAAVAVQREAEHRGPAGPGDVRFARDAAVAAVSGLYASSLAGRLLASRLARRTSAERLLAVALATALLGLPVLLTATDAPIAAVGIAVPGIGIGAMFPLTSALHVKSSPRNGKAGATRHARLGVGMLPTDHLVAFLLAVYVLIVVPGPSVMFTVSRGVALGRRAALMTVLGNTSGLLLQLVLVVVGLGSVLATSDTVFTVLKLVGAAYLVLLGLRSIRNRKALADALSPKALGPRGTLLTVREGFVVGATNPKGLVIFTAVLPEFIERSAGHPTLQLATLGAICIVIALLSDSTWALASGTARAWLGRSPARLERLSAGGGVAMILLGAGLALTGRRK